jgi:hypothetical protein
MMHNGWKRWAINKVRDYDSKRKGTIQTHPLPEFNREINQLIQFAFGFAVVAVLPNW